MVQAKFLEQLGSIRITLSCSQPQRLLNMLSAKCSCMTQVEQQECLCTFTLRLRDVPALRYVTRKTRARVVSIHRQGLYFTARSFWQRKGLVWGLLSFALMLFALTFFLWDISLEGGEQYQEQEMIQFLSSLGVTHGMLLSQVDCDRIEAQMREQFFHIAWVSAEIRGTRLILHIKEGQNLEMTQKTTTPQDLISPADGVVHHLVVRQGTPLVQVGDTVKKGQVLISGILPVYNDSQELTNSYETTADGDWEIMETIRYQDHFSLKQKIYQPTGNIQSDFYLNFLGFSTAFRWETMEFASSFQVKKENQIKILRNLYLPIKYGKIEKVEYKGVDVIRSHQEARNLAELRIAEYLKGLYYDHIYLKSMQKDVQVAGDECRLDVSFVCYNTNKTISVSLQPLPELQTKEP